LCEANFVPWKSRLALWIAWAYVRDISYWYWEWKEKWARDYTGVAHKISVKDGGNLYEAVDWDPVRRDLVTLGVPELAITRDDALAVPGGNMALAHVELALDVWGFCQWVASPNASKMLFASLPTQQTGFPLSKDRMAKMRLTRYGWFDTADPGASMWLRINGGAVP
jgi:hypothetical protein